MFTAVEIKTAIPLCFHDRINHGMAGLSSLIKVYLEESQSAVFRESDSDVYFGIHVPDFDNDYVWLTRRPLRQILSVIFFSCQQNISSLPV